MKNTILSTLFVLYALTCLGQNWTPLASPTSLSIVSCSFINENVGWVISGNSIHKTTDGGNSWTAQSFPIMPNRFFNSVHFINENVGIIACTQYWGYDPDLISTTLWTNDGGLTWEYKDVGNSSTYNSDAILVTPLIAYTIGQYGTSKRTIDGGLTWTPMTFSGVGFSGIRLFAVDENNIYFAGLHNIFMYGAIGKTTNSFWSIQPFMEIVATTDIFFIGNQGWSVGQDGFLVTTSNGGQSWQSNDSGTVEDFMAVSFKNTSEGWVTTNTGKIRKTIDGGETWSLDYDAAVNLIDITFKNLNGYGYAVGNNGTILKYDPALSTNSFSASTDITIYPNPASDRVYLENKHTDLAILQIEIYNLLGQTVKRMSNIKSRTTEIDIHTLQPGIYYFKIKTDKNTVVTKKVLIK